MKISVNFWTIIIGCGMLVVGFSVDGGLQSGIIVSEAEARIGRPASPNSVAGVSRRTTRRTIRRTSRYVNTLPRGCRTVVVEGTRLHQCGGTYYQASGGRYVVVNVN